MLTIRVFVVMDEMMLTVNTTLGTVVNEEGRVVTPALHSDSYQIAHDTAPQDLVQAVCQAVDEIEHTTQGRLYDHILGAPGI